MIIERIVDNRMILAASSDNWVASLGVIKNIGMMINNQKRDAKSSDVFNLCDLAIFSLSML